MAKTLFVAVTILSPNVLLNDSCFKIMVHTRKITENLHMTNVTFLHHFCRWPLTFSYSNSLAHGVIYSTYVVTSTLKRHCDYLLWQIVQRCIPYTSMEQTQYIIVTYMPSFHRSRGLGCTRINKRQLCWYNIMVKYIFHIEHDDSALITINKEPTIIMQMPPTETPYCVSPRVTCADKRMTRAQGYVRWRCYAKNVLFDRWS